MQPRDRMLAALELKQPDRVPVWELAFNEESIIKIARTFTDDVPELKPVSDMDLGEKVQLFQALCTLVEELDLDGITLVPLGRRDKVGEDLIRDELDIVYRLSDHGSPFPVEGPVKEASDLKTLKLDPPDYSVFMGLQFAIQ